MPAASVARTRYVQVVLDGRPVSWNVVPITVPIWAKFEQAAPWQRSTRYPLTPTLSADAVQSRSIWLPLVTTAVSEPGAVAGWVSGGPAGPRDPRPPTP